MNNTTQQSQNPPKDTKKRKWIVFSAWPYVNATPHLGNMIGSVLSGDTFVRYARSKGDMAIYASGSDAHGTPVAVSAVAEKMTPQELASKNHHYIKDLFEKWNISYDNYTQTHNPTHMKFVQDFYKRIEANGFISTKVEDALYCEKCKLFLPDRFVIGECPHCGSDRARGDQCDTCGKILEPQELINPKCKQCGGTPITRETEHWYLDFGKTEDGIRKFVENNTYLPSNARTASINFLKEGLPKRAVTRDLEWGIPALFKDAEEKTIYVWFEAVLGYISAVKEWAEQMEKKPELFNELWNDPETKTVYFIGKDNIIFHLIIFPGLIHAYNQGLPPSEQFVMPYNVSSTEFLNYENDKFSKSRGVGIWIDDAIELAPPAYWRYSLLRHRPEKQDTNFLWDQFEKDVREANDIIGNFIHRTLTFTWRQYDKKVPQGPSSDQYDEQDTVLVTAIQNVAQKVGDLMEHFKLKAALDEIITFARQGNVYINDKAPWKMIKEDKVKAGYTFYLAIQMVRSLAILLGPFIPSISTKIFKLLNMGETVDMPLWESASELKVPAGHGIVSPKPVFTKLDVKAMKEKLAKIHGQTLEPTVSEKSKKSKNSKKSVKDSKSKDSQGEEEAHPEISYSFFQKFQFKIGTVLSAEKVPKTDKLLKLSVDLGEEEPRTIVAGIAGHYNSDTIVNKQVVILANLEPKKIRGILSHGMVLAADTTDKGIAVLHPDKEVPSGAFIR